MFGYIKPYKDEMRLRDIRRYQSAYCALCNRLKDDYGLLARLTLSYDITFLLISLNSFAGEPKEEGRFRCPLVPFWTKTSEITEVCLEYASFINYWLSIEKLNDDLRDGHSFTRRVLRDLLSTNKRYRSARTKYGQVADELGAMLESVYKLEGNASGCDDFDELTNMFGTFFASIFDMGGILGQLPRLSEPYRRLFFNIGKWIYLMDAFDDFDRDQAKSNFNLITLLVVHNRPSSITKTEILEAAYCIHVQICTKVKDIVNELDGDIDACVENIVLFGMNYVFQQIRSKKYKECDGGNSCGGSGFLDYMVRNSKGI